MLTAVVIKDFDAADNDTGTACKVEVCKHNTNAQDACTIGTVLNYVSGSPGDSTNFAGTSVGPATYTPWDTGATAANWVIASTEYVSIKFGSTCDNGTAFQPIVSMWGVVVP